MNKLLIASCFIAVSAISATEVSRREYLELVERYPRFVPHQGDSAKGEIQIVLDPQEMEAIEFTTGRDVGVMKRDRYWLWVNDACIFPNGRKGVYGRILWVQSLESCPDVAVMPITADGKIVLNCNFRHATRSWEMQIPSGLVNSGETIEETARREAMEETGMLVDSLILLGQMAPDAGLTNTVIPIFMAKVLDQQEPQREDSEAIEEILMLTVPEIKEAFLQGYLERDIRGEKKQIFCRDSCLTYALFMYELSGY